MHVAVFQEQSNGLFRHPRGLVASPTSAAGFIVESWHSELFQLIVSQHILDELKEALAKPYFMQRVEAGPIRRYITEIQRRGVLTPITVEVAGIAGHYADDLVLAAALSAGASYVVTGDERLRAVGSYEDVALIGPGEFCQVLRGVQGSSPEDRSRTPRT